MNKFMSGRSSFTSGLLAGLCAWLFCGLAVAQTASSTALTSSVNPSTVGQSTTLTATVTGASPTGTVTFKSGTTSLSTVALSSGVASMSQVFASSGNRTLTAVYNGDANNLTSTSAGLTQTVTGAATTTSIASSINPAAVGQSTTLTATVSPSAATGTVTFKDGATTLGTGTLASGVATYSASFSSTGSHSLTAVYAGNASYTTSTSSALSQTVNGGGASLPSPPISPAPVVNYEYDAQGNPTKIIQAPGVSGFNFATQSSYDALSRRKDTTDAKSGVTQFGYDGLDRTVQITDPRSLVTQTPRNGLGDTTSLISPDTGTASHTYDAAGKLLTRTDSRGVLATYSYDPLNRPTGITYSQSGQTSLTYTWTYDQTGAGFSNGIGRLTSSTHPAGSAQYTYDPQGRLLSELQRLNPATGANAVQISTTVSYGYDAAGHITSITYPSGRVLSIGYSGGQPSAMSLAKDSASTPSTLIEQIKFAPFGGLLSWNWQMTSGPQANSRVYDTSGRLVRYRLANTIRDITYDAGDRITSYTHYDAGTAAATPALDQSFGYDELGRLTSISTASASWSIGYDANGNRTSVTLNGTARSYTTATTSNRLSAISNPARSFGYDNAGNTTSDGSYTSTYDLSGRLTTLTKSGATSRYAYDAMGKRVRKHTSTAVTTTVIFVYDQAGQLLGEYDRTGAALREYVWLGSTPIAVFTPDPANTANPPLTYFIHADHLDTPRVVVDKANAIRWRWLAEPFGTTAPETNPQSLGAFTQNLRFPGQYADSESGLSYNFFRDYDGSTGRYVQSDPIGLDGGINTYAYVGGSPASAVDPYGLVEIPNPNGVVPGGPWTPNDVNRPGNFLGPKSPNGGGRPQCQFVPDEANGGPPGSKGYWKTNQAGQKGWQRYNQNGEPISPEDAHPGGLPVPRIPGLMPLVCPACFLLEPIPTSVPPA